jgi:transaldolase/glucose-6-phosphate isomerase
VLLPIYESSQGIDGYVSLEVSPALAHDTEGTIESAKELFALLKRPNVMIKIPATPEGLPAITEAIAAGINVNVTLIFSQQAYIEVAEAYIRGLEQRVERGEPVDRIASVASFFVSRIDSAVDKLLEERIAKADGEERTQLQSLLGKAAIANAKLAYQKYKEIFEGERFAALKAKGAQPQRQLWASTGTKNPNYSDVLYVESLIGRDTVNTVPPDTLNAFRDHGRVRPTLEENVDEAREQLRQLAEVGISLDDVTTKLTADGVKSFADSFDKLTAVIKERREVATRKIEASTAAD